MPRYQSLCERFGTTRCTALSYLGGMVSAMARHQYLNADLKYVIAEGIIIGTLGFGAGVVAEAISDDFVRASKKGHRAGARAKQAFQLAAYAAGIAVGVGLVVPYLEQKRAEGADMGSYVPGL